jgi:hypothetical protein
MISLCWEPSPWFSGKHLLAMSSYGIQNRFSAVHLQRQ